ncbi:MAG: ABC transporter permease subunit, partial [Ktedonobacterales bacterium]
AVEQGQTEAAESLGLSHLQTARMIVLPQALRIMIPPLTNIAITLVQDTAFLQVLGIYELSLTVFSQTQEVSSVQVRWTFFAIELAVYFAICYSLAVVSRRLERRLAVSTTGAH